MDKAQAAQHYKKFQDLARNKEYDLARENLNLAVDLDPTNVEYLLERGILHFGAEDFLDAQKDYQAIIALTEDDGILYTAYNKLTHIGERTQNHELFIDSITWLINRGNDDYRFWRAGKLLKRGEYEKAIDDYSYLLSLNQQTFTPFFMRAQAYLGLQNYDAVIADTTRALACDDVSWKIRQWILNLRGYIYYKRGQYDLALQDAITIRQLGNMEPPSSVSELDEFFRVRDNQQ